VRVLAVLVLVLLAACSRAAATPTPSPSPPPIEGPIPAVVDDAFCDLARELEPLSESLAGFGQAVSDEGFSGALVQREAPVLRRAIAAVSPHLPTIARWAPTAAFASALLADLQSLDEGVAVLEDDPNDLFALAAAGLALRDVEVAFRDALPAVYREHPEVACPGSGG
jgi:hypothetical protein